MRTLVDWESPPMIRFFSSTEFVLAPAQILERDTSPLREDIREAGSDYETLSRDRVPVRSMMEDDLAAVVRIDRVTGWDRSAYYAAKLREMLKESGIRVSLVAEEDGFVVGFVMARVDFGVFGKVDKAAILDTIGVHPGFAGSGIGHALLSQLLPEPRHPPGRIRAHAGISGEYLPPALPVLLRLPPFPTSGVEQGDLHKRRGSPELNTIRQPSLP